MRLSEFIVQNVDRIVDEWEQFATTITPAAENMDSIEWENGEWHWSRHPDGSLNTVDDKAGFWKCPYHNSRMCLEVIERNI